MKITDQRLNHVSINKTFFIELDNGETIEIYKYSDHEGVENWEYASNIDSELTDNFSDDELDQLDDFITNKCELCLD